MLLDILDIKRHKVLGNKGRHRCRWSSYRLVRRNSIIKGSDKFHIYTSKYNEKNARFVLWLLGINKTTSEFTELFDRYATHIFSKAHIRDGIMKLGYSKRNIFDKGINIIQGKMVQAVNGSNEVRTTINGIKVTIRFYLSDGKIRSMDMFVGWSSRVIGKLLK